jgi:hypothetical protein
VESPWLWLAVFLSAAILSLTIISPRFEERQPQIERQYQARERSGYAVSAHQEPEELSQGGRLMIPLRPLQLLLVAGLLVCAMIFWVQRVRAMMRLPAQSPSRDETER